MNLHKILLQTTGVVLLLGTTSLVAADASAKSIMQNAFHYIEHMDKYAFDAVITYDEKNSDDTIVHRNDTTIKVDRPNKLRIEKRVDGQKKTFYLNKGQFIMLDHTMNYYTEVKTPKSIDGALDFLFKKYDITAPLSSLVYSSMKNRTHFKRSKNFGLRTLNGVECHYVAFKDRAREIHVWVATGEKPLVQAYSIIDTQLQGKPRTNTLISWRSDAKIVDNDFVFHLPKDAVKIPLDNK